MRTHHSKPLVALAYLGFSFLFVISGTYCSRKSQLAFQMEKKQIGENGCQPNEKDYSQCTFVGWEYPVFKGGNEEIRKSAQETVDRFLLRNDFSDAPLQSFDDLAQTFFKEHQDTLKDFPNMPSSSWTYVKKVNVDTLLPQILSLRLTQFEYMGGAHPNADQTFVNIDLNAGKTLKLEDLLKPNYLPTLAQAQEKAFRLNQELSPTQNLEEAGYLFEKGIFKPSENFSIAAKGLVFIFNAYEAAPYAAGPIEFTVPYADIQDLLPADGLLARIKNSVDSNN